MDKTRLNKVELQKKIQERRQAIAREKRLAEARERRAKALQETRQRQLPGARKVSRQLLERQKATQKPVIREALLNRRANKVETLTEAITRHNKAQNIPQKQTKLYKQLSENIANYANARKAIKENFNAAGQAGPNVFGVSDNQAGLGLVSTFLDIFYGFFPQLIAPQLASTQPLKTENGYIFYMQYTAGSTKGELTKGDVLMDPFQVASQSEYTSNVVTVGDVKENVEKVVNLWAPVKAIYINGVPIPNNATGNVVVDGKTVAVTVTITEVQLKLKVTSLGGHIDDLVATYEYDNVYVPTEVPLLTPNIVRIPIAARYRTIKTTHAFQAAYGYEAEHGDNLGQKLSDAAMEQLKREIDLDIVFQIMASAPSTIVWNRAAGVAVGGYQEHKLSFMDAVANAANLIFKKSKRVRGNILLVGVDVLTIVETLPAFTGVELGEQLPGAAVVGKLKKMPVIVSPDIPADEWAVIYKGQKENLDAGIVFAPYLPVFATEPAILDDFIVRQAFITAYATKVVNDKYFVRGRIINVPTALPIYLVNKDGFVGGEDGGDLDFGVLPDNVMVDIFGD